MLEKTMDQAHGLRRLFAQQTLHFMPVVSNPYVKRSAVLLDKLCQGLTGQGMHVLVVDATPHPSLRGVNLLDVMRRDLNLGQWVDELDSHVSVLTVGSSFEDLASRTDMRQRLFEFLRESAPTADLILFHADALATSRVFAEQAVRPLVLSTDDPASITEVYASIKLLVQCGHLHKHSMVLDLLGKIRGLPNCAVRLGKCVQDFLGAQLHLAALTSTRTEEEFALTQSMQKLSLSILHHALPFSSQEHATAPWKSVSLSPDKLFCAAPGFN